MGGMGMFNVAPPAAPKPAPAKAAAPAKDAEVQQLLKKVLDNRTTQYGGPFAGQAFAQVRDPEPFRLDNRSLEGLKKKPALTR